jgi:hypothetical protein
LVSPGALGKAASGSYRRGKRDGGWVIAIEVGGFGLGPGPFRRWAGKRLVIAEGEYRAGKRHGRWRELADWRFARRTHDAPVPVYRSVEHANGRRVERMGVHAPAISVRAQLVDLGERARQGASIRLPAIDP